MTVPLPFLCETGPTNTRARMAGQASSSSSSSSSNNGAANSNGDREIFREVMKIYLHRCGSSSSSHLAGASNGSYNLLQQKQQNGKINGSGPLMKELSSAVIGLTSDYEGRYSEKLNNLRSNWIIDANQPRESFKQVLDNVFFDNCNWGRVVTIFVFASMFLSQCQQQGIDEVTPADVCDWSVEYVSQHVLPWIKRNGNWMGLIRFYKDGESGAQEGPGTAAAAAGGNNDGGVLTRLLTVAGAGLAIAGLTSLMRA